MTPENLLLPPGTSLTITQSQIDLALMWDGMAGRHVIHLRQSLEEGIEDIRRDECIENAVLVFRNVVGMEVIADALVASEWPETDGTPEIDGDGEQSAPPSAEEWRRTREI
jgi:hypothetical protein